MRQQGGSDLRNFVHRVMDGLLSHELSKSCNMTGTFEKTKFPEAIVNLIFGKYLLYKNTVNVQSIIVTLFVIIIFIVEYFNSCSLTLYLPVQSNGIQ